MAHELSQKGFEVGLISKSDVTVFPDTREMERGIFMFLKIEVKNDIFYWNKRLFYLFKETGIRRF